MSTVNQLVGLLVSNDPRASSEKTLAFLLSLHGAKGGVVLAVQGSETTPFALMNVGLDRLVRVRSLWLQHERALRAARHAAGEDYLLAPLLEDGELVGALFLDAPRDRRLDDIYRMTLAKAIRAHRAGGPQSLTVEKYLASVSAQDVQREQLVLALNQNEWNIARVARLLGVTRRTIYMRMERYGIQRRRPPKTLKPMRSSI